MTYRIADTGVIRVDDDVTLLPGDAGWHEYELWLLSGGVLLPILTKPRWRSLAQARSVRQAELRIERALREAAGFTFRTKRIDSDTAARVRMFSIFFAAIVARLATQGFALDFVTADGSSLTLDLAGVLDLAQALNAHDKYCAIRAGQLRALIELADMATLATIDLTGGWPT